MQVHIVHAHPEPKSFSSAMATLARKILSDQGNAVTYTDLYAIGFNPVAKADDFASRRNDTYLNYALEQRHSFESGSTAPDIRSEVDNVVACDLLILNFPIYWFSMPAILKGWIDRVFLSGPFYGGKRFYDKGGMAGRKALVTATLGGREHMFGPNAIHGEINDMLRPLLRGSLAYVGFDVLEPFYAYHIPYLGPEARNAVIADFHSALSTWATRPHLHFPKMSQFDDKLIPLSKARQ
jgi:NAD(P)H dehydrogenase (quinone)